MLSVKDPSELPWKDLGVEIVFESTGRFTDRDAAAKHLAAGAKKVIITAPAKKPDVMLVMGVNDGQVRPGEAPHHLECLVHDELPGAVAKVLHEHFGIVRGWMTMRSSSSSSTARTVCVCALRMTGMMSRC